MKNFIKSRWVYTPVVLSALVISFMIMVVGFRSPIDEYLTERAIMRLSPPQEFIEGRVSEIVVVITDHPWPDEEGSRSTVVYLCSGDTWSLATSEGKLHNIEHWAFVYTSKRCD